MQGLSFYRKYELTDKSDLSPVHSLLFIILKFIVHVKS